jgi:hypothetical protein
MRDRGSRRIIKGIQKEKHELEIFGKKNIKDKIEQEQGLRSNSASITVAFFVRQFQYFGFLPVNEPV